MDEPDIIDDPILEACVDGEPGSRPINSNNISAATSSSSLVRSFPCILLLPAKDCPVELILQDFSEGVAGMLYGGCFKESNANPVSFCPGLSGDDSETCTPSRARRRCIGEGVFENSGGFETIRRPE